jgi:hypothetical protein
VTGQHPSSAPRRPPDPRFGEVWTDTIRDIHAEINPDAAAITYTRPDGTPARLTGISLGILLPDRASPGICPYYLETTATTQDGDPCSDTYRDGEQWPPELGPLIPALRNAQPYDPDAP